MAHSINHSCFDIKACRNEQIQLVRNHTVYETSNQAILILASTMGHKQYLENWFILKKNAPLLTNF